MGPLKTSPCGFGDFDPLAALEAPGSLAGSGPQWEALEEFPAALPIWLRGSPSLLRVLPLPTLTCCVYQEAACSAETGGSHLCLGWSCSLEAGEDTRP